MGLMTSLKKTDIVEDEIREVRKLEADLKQVVRFFEGIGVDDFVQYIGSKKKIFWMNFFAGVARGLGVIIGMTVVIAILVWILSYLVNFPLIGQYFLELKTLLEGFAPQ